MFDSFLEEFNQEEQSWIKYDIANSAYTLTIVTVLFPLLYLLITKGAFSANESTNNNIANSILLYATGIISFIVAILSPILGTMSDFKGHKKKFFKASLSIGLIFGLLLCIPVIPWQVILIIYSIATIGYTAANVFYDSFLTDVTTEDRYNKVSSAGYAWGYIGSCIPFILGIGIYGLVYLEIIKFDPKIAIAIAFAISLLWWWFYSLPMLKNVEQKYYLEKSEHWIKDTFTRLGKTIKKIIKQPKLVFYLLAYFFFIDAVYSIIKSAVIIAKSHEVTDMALLAVSLVVQVIAFPCAIAFGAFAKKFGEIKMLAYGIMAYIGICLIGYFLGHMTGSITVDLLIFVALIGSAQGGLQAVSRAYFGKLIPKHESGEYYGFFNIFGRFASVMGPILMGLTVSLSNNTRLATLALIPLLLIGLVLLIISSRYKLDKNELTNNTITK
ncbi:MFS transporter [Mycoplasmatota bacterium]|nr:MFS transporter [Mycoplasmatota bacterium]